MPVEQTKSTASRLKIRLKLTQNDLHIRIQIISNQNKFNDCRFLLNTVCLYIHHNKHIQLNPSNIILVNIIKFSCSGLMHITRRTRHGFRGKKN